MRTLLLTAAVLVATVATAEAADPVALAARTSGSSLELTFTNVSTAPVTMTTHVRAGRDHHDWLTVKLTGAATRTMKFWESRDKSAPIDATIAPGATVSRTIDLAAWAILAGNGGPLAPGTYDLEATWDARSPKMHLVATAKLVIAAPVEKRCTDKASTGLVMLVRQAAAGGPVEIGIHNVDGATHCIAGYIKTHEIQSDWLTLDVHPTSGRGAPRKIGLNDDRNKSYPVHVELAPGATHWMTWDLAAWALRKRNGAAALGKGMTWVDAVYDATRETDVWRGTIKETFVATF
jgi:hypothetical protein